MDSTVTKGTSQTKVKNNNDEFFWLVWLVGYYYKSKYVNERTRLGCIYIPFQKINNKDKKTLEIYINNKNQTEQQNKNNSAVPPEQQ